MPDSFKGTDHTIGRSPDRPTRRVGELMGLLPPIKGTIAVRRAARFGGAEPTAASQRK